jgi:predicted nucleotidyltransferase
VAQTPADGDARYRIRFADGDEAVLHRQEFTIRREEQARAIEPDADVDWYRFVIYRCVVGSRAYGLDEPGSDTDERGIYLPPADLHWSLRGVPEQLEDDAAQTTYWELEKFLTLALKANPNILECLFTPLIEFATPLAQELLAMRSVFLSKLVYQTYNGYVLSQFKKLEADLRNHGVRKWKHVMHLIRLLLAGIVALREGVVPIHVGEHRDALLAIRRGQMPWEEIDAWRLRLHSELDAAYQTTRLPERPDHERANAFLIRARRSMVDQPTWRELARQSREKVRADLAGQRLPPVEDVIREAREIRDEQLLSRLYRRGSPDSTGC